MNVKKSKNGALAGFALFRVLVPLSRGLLRVVGKREGNRAGVVVSSRGGEAGGRSSDEWVPVSRPRRTRDLI